MEYMGSVAPDTDFTIKNDEMFPGNINPFEDIFHENDSVYTSDSSSCGPKQGMVKPVSSSEETTTVQLSSSSYTNTRPQTTRPKNIDGRVVTNPILDNIQKPNRKGKRVKQRLTMPAQPVYYTCSVCSTTWLSVYALKRHERSHSGDKPFKCTECPQAFSQEVNLRVHIEAIHDKLKHSCPICLEPLSSSANLAHHLKKTHADYLGVYCSRCETWMRGDLVRHQETNVCEKKSRAIQNKTTASAIKSMLETIEEDDVANALCGQAEPVGVK